MSKKDSILALIDLSNTRFTEATLEGTSELFIQQLKKRLKASKVHVKGVSFRVILFYDRSTLISQGEDIERFENLIQGFNELEGSWAVNVSAKSIPTKFRETITTQASDPSVLSLLCCGTTKPSYTSNLKLAKELTRQLLIGVINEADWGGDVNATTVDVSGIFATELEMAKKITSQKEKRKAGEEAFTEDEPKSKKVKRIAESLVIPKSHMPDVGKKRKKKIQDSSTDSKKHKPDAPTPLSLSPNLPNTTTIASTLHTPPERHSRSQPITVLDSPTPSVRSPSSSDESEIDELEASTRPPSSMSAQAVQRSLAPNTVNEELYRNSSITPQDVMSTARSRIPSASRRQSDQGTMMSSTGAVASTSSSRSVPTTKPNRHLFVNPRYPMILQMPPLCRFFYRLSYDPATGAWKRGNTMCREGDDCPCSHEYILTDEQVERFNEEIKHDKCRWVEICELLPEEAGKCPFDGYFKKKRGKDPSLPPLISSNTIPLPTQPRDGTRQSRAEQILAYNLQIRAAQNAGTYHSSHKRSSLQNVNVEGAENSTRSNTYDSHTRPSIQSTTQVNESQALGSPASENQSPGSTTAAHLTKSLEPPVPMISTEPTRTIFIHRISSYTTAKKLRSLFSRFGKVDDVRIRVHREGMSAFVEYEHLGSAKALMKRYGSEGGHTPLQIGEKSVTMEYHMPLPRRDLGIVTKREREPGDARSCYRPLGYDTPQPEEPPNVRSRSSTRSGIPNPPPSSYPSIPFARIQNLETPASSGSYNFVPERQLDPNVSLLLQTPRICIGDLVGSCDEMCGLDHVLLDRDQMSKLEVEVRKHFVCGVPNAKWCEMGLGKKDCPFGNPHWTDLGEYFARSLPPPPKP